MKRIRSTLLAAALALLAATPAIAQQPTLVGDLGRDATQVRRKLVGLAEAMPEGSYDWRPMEGVRSVAEVLKHVVSDNYLLGAVSGAAAPEATGIKPDDYRTALAYEARSMSKAEIVTALNASFDFLGEALKATSEARLTEEISVFGSAMTGQALWLLTLTHLHEHLGQSIAYARSNGVVPPWSR